jgi:hypothetical protein
MYVATSNFDHDKGQDSVIGSPTIHSPDQQNDKGIQALD